MADAPKFEIFTGVDVPAQKRGGFAERESKYPWAQMDVGDLLVIPGTTSKKFGGTVRAGEKKTGFAFVLRSGPVVGKDEKDQDVTFVPEGGVGVWRVASKPARAPRKPKEAKAAA
jgi:hypothetical protein